MSAALDIFALQGTDDAVTGIEVALADAERRLEGDPELLEAREALAATEAALRDARARQRALDLELKGFDEKVAREDGKLYGGSVKNVKELQSLQREVEGLKAQRGVVEERLLGVIDEVETLDGTRATEFRRLAQLEGRWLQESATLRSEVQSLKGRLAAMEPRRKAEAAAIPPRALVLYESLRSRKGGKAAVRITGGICSGCRVTIPEALRRRAVVNPDPVQCPNCERILVVG